MRHTLCVSLGFTLVMMTAAVSNAQALAAQLRSSVVLYKLNSAGQMELVGELPSGAVVQLEYNQVSQNPVTGRPDLQQTLNRWMQDREATAKPRGAGVYTSAAGKDHFFPAQINHVRSGTEFKQGHTLYFAHKDIKNPNAMQALGQRPDFDQPRPSAQIAKTLSANTSVSALPLDRVEGSKAQASIRAASASLPRAAASTPRVRKTIGEPENLIPPGALQTANAENDAEIVVVAPRRIKLDLPPREPITIANQGRIEVRLNHEDLAVPKIAAEIRPAAAAPAARIAPAPERVMLASMPGRDRTEIRAAARPEMQAAASTALAPAQAARSVAPARESTESESCTNCHLPADSLAPVRRESALIQEAARSGLGPTSSGSMRADWTASEKPLITALPSRNRKLTAAAACNAMMTESGEVGQLGIDAGRMLMSPEMKSDFFKSNAMGTFCPKFDRLSDQKQLQAWIWLLRALMRAEAQCDPSTVHKTHDSRGRILNLTKGYGFLTVELEKRERAKRNRAPICDDVYRMEGNRRIPNPQAQLGCGLSMIQEYQVGVRGGNLNTNGNFGPLMQRHNWAEKKMMPHMRRFADCF